MNIFKSYFNKLLFVLGGCAILGLLNYQSAFSQIAEEIRWLRVGSLHHYISNSGIETEEGTGAGNQVDGLRWPAQYDIQDAHVGKSMWIGTTNFYDTIAEETYPHKIVSVGPKRAHKDLIQEIMPYYFKVFGRFQSPNVLVDFENATNNQLYDIVDKYDENLPCDRMIVTKMHTSIGITITRKVMAFSQQYHDNYIVYDYILKNTGIIDLDGTVDSKELTGIILHFANRYAPAHEAFYHDWAPINNVDWGRNTINHVIGTDPTASDFQMRAQYSWYGPHSNADDPINDWGAPNYFTGQLGAVQYCGTVTLHADKSPLDNSDDPAQPLTTHYFGSDKYTSSFDQYNAASMTRKYEDMIAGHAAVTHAEEVGNGFADIWGSDNGGYSACFGYGPYTLEPGDSIHIVYAEGVSGIDRIKSLEVGTKWMRDQSPFIMPDGSQSNDNNDYKNKWVQTGEDSILQTLNRASLNYNSEYNIPQPPPPPDLFEVKSGGNRIMLSWSNNAENSDNFNGYKIYRAIAKPDTSFEKIFECDNSNIVNTFNDETARRGFDYYYYIQSKDDGSTNDIEPDAPLVSGKFYTMTNKPAYLLRPAGESLSEIRIVPNPYNIRARELQFGIDAADRIAFYGLPPECNIKIFTERGDLIKQIEHIDGSGDERWNSLTSSGQMIVSGLYIAYFEATSDYVDPITGKLLFKKGDHTIRKFVVIR